MEFLQWLVVGLHIGDNARIHQLKIWVSVGRGEASKGVGWMGGAMSVFGVGGTPYTHASAATLLSYLFPLGSGKVTNRCMTAQRHCVYRSSKRHYQQQKSISEFFALQIRYSHIQKLLGNQSFVTDADTHTHTQSSSSLQLRGAA